MQRSIAIVFALMSFSVFAQTTQPGESMQPRAVKITVNAGETLGPMKPIWRFFGADEPNYAYMKDGQKLIAEQGKLLPGGVYFRAHNLLTTGDGTPALKWGSTNAFTITPQGEPVYDWSIVDRIFDTYLQRNVRPYVQIGFMPEAMSVKPQPYQHSWTPKAKYDEIYTGWAYPPKDYEKWAELVFQWTKHCVEKYGKDEVEQWYWEVWNEPNIGYWRGTPEEFRKLHDYAIDAVRRALPSARVGGPDVAGHGAKFMREFLEHCLRGKNHVTGETGTPIDFISFHSKGAPQFVDGHVRMGIAAQLKTIDEGFEMIASYPELKSKPIVIGESDPDGCAACQGPQLGYRNGTMYSSYTAASFARKYELMDRHGVNLEGALTWAFEFEDQPYFAGFRVLSSNGLTLPVFNVFRMFSKMSGTRIAVESNAALSVDEIIKNGVRAESDVSALASLDGNKLAILLWHYHDDDLPGAPAAIDLAINNLPVNLRNPKLTQYVIDEKHSNAFTAWKAIGSPQNPTPEQYAQLLEASNLQSATQTVELKLDQTSAGIQLPLARQGVTLLLIEWDR